MSRYGEWRTVEGLPAFFCSTQEAESPQQWNVVGNRGVSLWCANDGTVALWDESDCLRWITAPDPEGTGVSRLRVDGHPAWTTSLATSPVGTVPVRTFGPTWFGVSATGDGVEVERTVLCPEGELPWVLVRVVLRSTDGRPHDVVHEDEWRLRPRPVLLGTSADRRRALSEAVISYAVEEVAGSVRATEVRSSTAPDVLDRDQLAVIEAAFGGSTGPTDVLAQLGTPRTVVLQSLGDGGLAAGRGEPHPTLVLRTAVRVEPGAETVLWARFGRDEHAPAEEPAVLFDRSMAGLRERLPVGETPEIPWHAALLTGAAAKDEVMGGHSLDQGSAYSFALGVDAATRDTLQHALPLVYLEPDLALSVLRHCAARATPTGDLPYGLDAGKRPWTSLFQPSDQNLYALWLASEYLAATGDVAGFREPVAYHPVHAADPVDLTEHLRRQFRFFVDEVGLGERGHVRLRNGDWNDGVVGALGAPHDEVVAKGESVLNSAFAAWVLPVWAGAADRLGLADVAVEARSLAGSLTDAVRDAWNGTWFQRAYAPGVPPVGDGECWLEPQPWAILCGAADADQTQQLLDTIDRQGRSGSPLGCRALFPAQGDRSQVWYAVNSTLVWAAARAGADWAWDEWRSMSLARHTEAFPDVWEGTLSGPDAWLGPEASRPGRTWSAPEAGISMQAFPVANAHAHAQPLLGYLRLLGVEPGTDGALLTGAGAFRSRTLELDEQGHGRLSGPGELRVRTKHGTVNGTQAVTW